MHVPLPLCNTLLMIGLVATTFSECGWNLGDRDDTTPVRTDSDGERS